MGLVEGRLARLVDHRFAGNRRKLGNDGMSRLAADQDAAHRPLRADPKRRIAALELPRGPVGQIRAMAFAGMDDVEPALPPPDLSDGPPPKLQRGNPSDLKSPLLNSSPTLLPYA